MQEDKFSKIGLAIAEIINGKKEAIEDLKILLDKHPEMVDKVRQYMLKRHNEQLIENSYWMDMLTSYYWENENKHTNYEKFLNNISSKDIQRLAKKILNSGNVIQISMTGESEQ